MILIKHKKAAPKGIVPSGFKECLDADEVALAMKRFDQSIDMEVIPMIDAGEGFAKAITNIKGGELIYKERSISKNKGFA